MLCVYDTRLVNPFLSGAYPEDIIPKGQYLHLPTYFQVIDPLHIITWYISGGYHSQGSILASAYLVSGNRPSPYLNMAQLAKAR